jgi:hypothetical protein
VVNIYTHMSNYKSYFLRQLGIKESQFAKSTVNDPYNNIDPDELENGTDEEGDEHGFSPDIAKKTALDHLTAPKQGHYYSGVEKAKDQGMLKEKGAFGNISPTARQPSVLAINVRGTPGGNMPTSLSMPSAPVKREVSGVNVNNRAALGGFELINKKVPNSTVVDSTPQNNDISSAGPISDEEDKTPSEDHPAQIQNLNGDSPQSLTGTSDDIDDFISRPLGNDDIGIGVNNELESEFPVDCDDELEVTDDELEGPENELGSELEQGEENEEEEEEEEFLSTLDETFKKHSRLMRSKLRLDEKKKELLVGEKEKDDVKVSKKDKKSKKVSTKKLKAIQEQLYNKSKKTSLNELELKISKQIISTLRSRKF